MILRGISIALGMVFLLTSQVSQSAEPTAKADMSDAAKRRIAREGRFLQRAIEDLETSYQYVVEDISSIEKQIDEIQLGEPARRENEFRSLVNWYQDYAEWLSEMSAEFGKDLEQYYTGAGEGKGWANRYAAMKVKYKLLEDQLREKVKRSEDDKAEHEKTIARLKSVIERLSKERELEKARPDKPGKGEDAETETHRKKRDLDVDTRIVQIEGEIRNLEYLLKHLDIVIEKELGALDWITLKGRDCEALSEVSEAIRSSALSPQGDAFNRMIRTYESDISHLRRKSEDADRKLSRIIRTGTLRTLDRLEDLSDYYEQMKNRYDHHSTWLRLQIGGYRADVTEILNERR